MKTTDKQRQSNWSAYWRKDLISSCTAAIQSSDSDIDMFWQDCARSIKDKDLIVDLCTGKGALIELLMRRLRDEEKEIEKLYGVDLAIYEKDKTTSIASDERVELFLGTRVDSIPLSDNSVTCFISQYGVEYALTEEFYQETARLLCKGGNFYAVLHHSESVLCDIAKKEIEQIQFLQNELDLFTTAKELHMFFAKLKNPANLKKLNSDQKAMQLRAEYNKKSALVRERINIDANTDILTTCLEVMANSFQTAKLHGKAEARKLLDAFQYELEASKFRSLELLEAALNKSDMQDFLKNFERIFELQAEFSELNSRNRLVAWGLRFTRV